MTSVQGSRGSELYLINLTGIVGLIFFYSSCALRIIVSECGQRQSNYSTSLF